MAKRNLVTFVVALLVAGPVGPVLAQPANYSWAVSSGSSGNDFGWAAETDSDGNLYIAGATPGGVAITKYTTAGAQLWTTSVATGSGRLMRMAFAPDGSLVTVGYFSTSATFPGLPPLSSNGNADIVVARLDASDGTPLDAANFGGLSDDEAFDVDIDPAGRVYVAASYDNDSTAPVSFGSQSLSQLGHYDQLYMKLEADFEVVWVRGAGKNGWGAVGYGIAVDSQGDVVVCGSTHGSATFYDHNGTILGVSPEAGGSNDAAVAKFDTDGNFLWLVGVTGPNTNVYDCDVDQNDNIYVAGGQESTSYFGHIPGQSPPTAVTVTSRGGADAYIAKLDSTGVAIWANNTGSAGTDSFFKLRLDDQHGVIGTGYLHGSAAPADFDGQNLAQFGDTQDILFAHWALDGTPLWADSAGSVDKDWAYEAAFHNNTVFLTGAFQNSVQFGLHTLASAGSFDTWVVAAELASADTLVLAIDDDIPAAEGATVDVDVDFTSGGQSIAATTFSVDYDQSCLDFDESDADPVDGIPDAIDVQVPADFSVAAFHDLGDDDGEIDVSIVDFSPPISALPDGPLLSVTFTATCSPVPGTTITAPVVFSTDPAASFSDDLAQDVDGGTSGGSVVIYPGPRGDCNGSGEVAAADLVADGLEIFDGDGSFWLDVPGGTFPGSPVGCDANADTEVDAGDVSCTILLIFGGTCGGGGSRLALRPPPVLRIDGTPRVQPGRPVRIPVRFESHGHQVSSLAFSLDLEPRRLRFDPADRDRDGVPDAVRFPARAPTLTAVRFDRRDRDGELDVLLSLDPGATFEDGVLFEIEVEPVRRGRVGKALRFSSAPQASFGNLNGDSVTGRTVVDREDKTHR